MKSQRGFMKSRRDFMKSQRGFTKSRCDFNFMQPLNLFFPAYENLFPNERKENHAQIKRQYCTDFSSANMLSKQYPRQLKQSSKYTIRNRHKFIILLKHNKRLSQRRKNVKRINNVYICTLQMLVIVYFRLSMIKKPLL